MKRLSKYILAVAIASAVAGSLTSCVKAYEDECVEIIHRPQVDITPDSPDWDDKETQKIE